MRNTARGQIWLPTLKREFESRRDVRREPALPCAADMALELHWLLALPSPFCIALNRSHGRRQEGVEPRLYDGVALAGCLFEAETIQNLNVSSMIADKACRLQR
jgi:hypothetical protein